MTVHSTKLETWRRSLLALTVAIGGAALGLAMAAPRADAAPAAFHWGCNSSDRCGAGDSRCCEDNFGGTGHCNSLCPVIING